jgi:CRP-like cAMP-binding protein
MTFQAVEESIAFHLPLSAITEICTTFPDFRLRLAALSERNYSTVALKVIGDLMVPSTERRIAAVLLRIAKADLTAENPQYWPIFLTQSEIGQMANASRDRVSLAIAKFEAAGWIKCGYREITLLDPKSLARHVSGQR